MKKADLQAMCRRMGLIFHDSMTNAELESVIASSELRKMGACRADFIREDVGEPMLAYPAAKLDKRYVEQVLNSPLWYAQPKYNGVRLLIVCDPRDKTLHMYGRNRSVKNLVYKDYTGSILLKKGGEFLDSFEWGGVPFILDCEAWSTGYIMGEDGVEERDNNALTTILTTKDKALRESYQKTTCPVTITAFDMVPLKDKSQPLLERYAELTELVKVLGIGNIQLPEFMTNTSKEQLFKSYVRNGGEGLVLKHVDCRYIPGSRAKEFQIKMKRNVSGFTGYEVDAFISAIYDTPEWSKKGLIGGLKLSAYIEGAEASGEPVVIANVTGMPMTVREDITENPEKYLNGVLVIDGMDISRRNRLITHAKVDWKIGLREDKSPNECVLCFGREAIRPDTEDYEAEGDY